MNKKEFLKSIALETNLSEEECILVSDALDDNFFLSKSNEEATIKSIMNNLKCDIELATSIYNTCVSIVKREIKNKLKHPFKSLD